MGKRFSLCPKCGKKGVYRSFGYPKGVRRCRYCGHTEKINQKDCDR